MPLRPRSHTIEDESERRFRDAIPGAWVVRRLVPDYGIDLTVEIFDETGHATPFSFHVQLKATDEEDVGKALRSIRFRRDLAEHYWSLPIPVLIVRYHAPSGRLYARWWHAYNPLVAARPDEDAHAPTTETVGFVFNHSDAWTDRTPEELVHGVESFRRFRSPDLPLPLTFSVSLADGMDADELSRRLLALRGVVAPVSDLIALRPGDPGPDRPHIVIGAAASTVALADVASVTIDHDDAHRDVEVASANLGCAIAMVLASVGQPNRCAQVALACAAKSSLVTGIHAAFTFAGAFYRSNRISDALTLVSDLARRRDVDSRIAAFVINSAALARGPHLTDAEAEKAVDVARAMLDETLDGGDAAAAAADSYNLARALGRVHRWEEAVSAFEQAAALDPDYENRPYFHADLAAGLFEAGRFDEAVEHYERAVESGSEPWWIATLADSLMLAGRYRDAEHHFAEYLKHADDPADCIWRLKHRVVKDLRSLVGDVQARRPEEAAALADRLDLFDPGLTDELAFGLLQEAIAADACCGGAHNRRMFLSAREGPDGEPDMRGAVEPAISAAVLHRGDPDDWVNAIRVAADAGEPEPVLYDLMRVGVWSGGPEVIQGVAAATTPPLSREQLELLDRVVQDLAAAKREEGFTLRWPTSEGTQEIPFTPPMEQ